MRIHAGSRRHRKCKLSVSARGRVAHVHIGEMCRAARTTPAKTSAMVVFGSASMLSLQMMAASENDGLLFVLCAWRLERYVGELGLCVSCCCCLFAVGINMEYRLCMKSSWKGGV